ncbi:MAG TPA: hypothetical protein VLU46_01880 [Thermoanaerobaculia bacterium]|nr:hypothetical protein [Thermoanaerobaculia bacterium]
MISAIVIAAILSNNAENTLVAKYGEAQRVRIHRGLQQVAEFWRPEDGDQAAFDVFVTTNFAGDPQTLDALFNRMQFALESLDGHLSEISRDWKWQSDLDLGPIYPFDETMAAYDPSAHVNDDLFQNKLAFTVLLNFPLTTLDERNNNNWSRRQWAEAKLALRFSKRIPADVNTAIAKASADASQFVATYNIYMGHLTAGDFPKDLRLLEHWNLRDEIKAEYSLPKEQALPKQRVIQRVMERIIDATIPPDVVNNPSVEWNPFDAKTGPGKNRYDYILETFHAARKVDPYSPTAPTHILRRFNEDRQLPEERVKQMLDEVLTSPLVPQVAKLIEKRLGRPLEPFDIWYNGFRPRVAYSEAQLDEIVRKRYPNASAYKADMPNLFRGLGFSPERADYLAKNIEVDPARGSGHALPASRRGDNPHLRTRVGANGMDYKGFNIAVHEMGHNVEQVFSLKDIDYYTLASVPNTAFTEALAMIFQRHDLELLGLSQPSAANRALNALDEFWNTYEISGVAMVDMQMWHWMYDHPDATPAQLRDAVVQIAKDTWNRYYAPVFHKRDVTLLAVYAHMVSDFMYLPDYPIGHMIAAQIEQQIDKAGAIGPEFERMARIGSVTPDQWMITATGKPVGPQALLDAAQRALQQIR